MRVHLLGVCGPYPASLGATSGYLLEAEGRAFQFDLGSGVLSRLTAVFPPEDLDAVFLSHWHFDHACDLLPLIYRLESLGAVLRVYAPEDPSSALRAVVSGASCFDLRTVAAGDELDLDGVHVKVLPARHPIPGVGYRVEAGGKSFGYTGDTNTLPGLSGCYRGCGLLLADGLFPSDLWEETKPHLSAALAARLARDAGVERLVLTHLNPSIPQALLLKEAREFFPDVRLASAGAVLEL